MVLISEIFITLFHVIVSLLLFFSMQKIFITAPELKVQMQAVTGCPLHYCQTRLFQSGEVSHWHTLPDCGTRMWIGVIHEVQMAT